LKFIAGTVLGGISVLLGAIRPVQALAEEPVAGVHRVVAEVSRFRNTRGFLGCRLFRSADGFPEGGKDTLEVRVPVAAAVTRCEFRDVPDGRYAIAVMHDENGNGLLDKNFIGVPTEGYGVSNNRTHAMSSPTWRDSTFEVRAQDVILQIRLRY
jgi:uncharacterized protein (DUF2141 family)